MEIIIALVIIGVGLIWYFNAKKKDEANLPTAEPVKATVNAADLAVKEEAKPLLTIPVVEGVSAGGVFNPVSLPVTVAAPEPAPAKKPRVGKKAATTAKAADRAAKSKTAAKKTPVRKSGGKKVG